MSNERNNPERWSLPLVRPYRVPVFQPYARLAELLLTIKAFMPRVPDQTIITYIAEQERMGQLLLNGTLPDAIAAFQDYLEARSYRNGKPDGDGPPRPA
jgi:hypothetical protein